MNEYITLNISCMINIQSLFYPINWSHPAQDERHKGIKASRIFFDNQHDFCTSLQPAHAIVFKR